LPTFTFNSSNTAVATVSPGGLVCGGVWDAFFVVCNGLDSSGNPIAGSAVVTASAQGVTSVPVQVTVHPAVNRIIVDPVTAPPGVPNCLTIKTTHQFTAHACTSAGTPDANPPCGPGGHEITSLIGPFTWASQIPNVGVIDANGLATAGSPGLTGITASVGSVSSATADFRSCMPVQITLHINGDPAGQPTESVTMSVGTSTTPNTKIIQADMVDELGVTTNSAPVVINNNNPVVASVSGTTLTATSAGGATLVASCVPPTCGQGLNLPVYSNPFQVTVTGTSPQPLVFATSSFPPPSGTPSTLIPIDSSKSPIAAGTPIPLPGTANSMVFAPGGAKAFLGTSAGIASFDPASSTVTLLDPFVGKVLAISPDGNTAIFSNAATDPTTGKPIEPRGPFQRLVIVTGTTLERFVLQGAVAASFTSDGFKAFIAADCSQNNPAPTTCPPGNGNPDGNVMVFSPFLTLQVLNINGTSDNVSVVTLPSGAYAYFANTNGLEAMATCNNTQLVSTPALNSITQTTSLQLLGATGNANLIVAVDSTGIDVVTATVAPALTTTFPFPVNPASCAPPISHSSAFTDFGQGPFTAHQLLVPANATGGNNGSHVVVLPSGTPNLFVAVPGSGAEVIPLTGAGATEALSGGITPDGNTAWVGVSGSNTVDQILLTNSPGAADAVHIKTSFLQSDGVTPAPPNIVAVQPK
jgi:hypothetical protein